MAYGTFHLSLRFRHFRPLTIFDLFSDPCSVVDLVLFIICLLRADPLFVFVQVLRRADSDEIEICSQK